MKCRIHNEWSCDQIIAWLNVSLTSIELSESIQMSLIICQITTYLN